MPSYSHDAITAPSAVDARKAKAVAAGTGATVALSLQEVAQASPFIVTMLPNTSNVEEVYLGTSHQSPEGATADDPSLSQEKQRVRQAGSGDTESERGLLDWVRSGTLVVDSSTIDPLASRRVNAIAESKVKMGQANEGRPALFSTCRRLPPKFPLDSVFDSCLVARLGQSSAAYDIGGQLREQSLCQSLLWSLGVKGDMKGANSLEG